VCCKEVYKGKRETEGWATRREAKCFKGVGYSTGKGGLVIGWGLWLLGGLNAGLG
jgi:hypothetical protein